MKTLLIVILYAAFVSALNLGGAVWDSVKAGIARSTAPAPVVSTDGKASHG